MTRKEARRLSELSGINLSTILGRASRGDKLPQLLRLPRPKRELVYIGIPLGDLTQWIRKQTGLQLTRRHIADRIRYYQRRLGMTEKEAIKRLLEGLDIDWRQL